MNSKALFLDLGTSEVHCELQYGQLRKKKNLEKQFGEKKPEFRPIPRFCRWSVMTSISTIVLAGFGGTHVATDLTTQS